MVFQIQDNGGNWVDITPYIAFNGLKWSRNDVEAANAGRMQNGEMQRDRVAIKYRWDVTCRPVTAQEQADILTLINPVYVEVKYNDPLTNSEVTGTYYSNNIPSTFAMRQEWKDANGSVIKSEEYWTGLAFPLVQR